MSDSTGNKLDWHESRRAHGIPTLSVLLGPKAFGHRLWRTWNAGKHRRVVVGSDFAGLVGDWLRQQIDLTDCATEWVRRNWTGTEFPELVRMTAYDLSQLWRELPSPTVDPVASIAYRILTARIGSAPFDRENAVGAFGSARVLAGLCGLISERQWPAFLVCDSTTRSRNGLLPVIREFEQTSKLVPRLPLAVSVSEQEFEAAVEQPSRLAALAREGEIRLSGVSESELTQRLRGAGVPEPLPVASIQRLTESGLAEEVAEAYVAAVVQASQPPATLDPHRSASERFLFEQLESMIETAGLFTPNRELEFLHGTKSAEADIASRELKLAIEIDGEYYHLNAEQYRRDRRKDRAYQQHGYWVLRFLAEDIVADLEGILNTILEAVASRRSAD